MAALSAVVFTLSWWHGLYLLARDPRKRVLALAAIGLCSFVAVVALDAVRVTGAAPAGLVSHLEIYLVAVPGVVWFAVISTSTLGAMVAALVRPRQPVPVAGVVIVATLFFALLELCQQ